MAPPQSINRMHPTSMGEAVGFLATFFSAYAEVFVWPRFVTFAWYLALRARMTGEVEVAMIVELWCVLRWAGLT